MMRDQAVVQGNNKENVWSSGMNIIARLFFCCCLNMTVIGSTLVFADDIDLFRTFNVGTEDNAANVLFILDASGSMSGSMGNISRMEAMKQSFNKIISNIFESQSNLNIAVSVFPSSKGGSYVLSGFKNTNPNIIGKSNHDALRLDLINKVNSLTPGGGTPINGSLWDAKNYFYGEAPEYSTVIENDPDAIQNGKFISPFRSSCQSNHIVLLSDGKPNASKADTQIKALTLPLGSSFTPPKGKSECSGNQRGSCAEKLSQWFFEKDHSQAIEGQQNIRIHTIGLANTSGSLDYLKYVATEPSDYYQANSSDELADNIANILAFSTANVDPLLSPSVSVNTYNSLEHRDHLYYAMFAPNTGDQRWQGNIKRYRIGAGGTVLDINDQPALDAQKGGFADSAQSWWASDMDGDGQRDNDGNNPIIGGFATAKPANKASLHRPNRRNLYTYWGQKPTLSDPVNRFPSDPNNNGIQASEFTGNTMALFRNAMQSAEGYQDDEFYAAMLWLRGGNDSKPHGEFSDIIHNNPALVNYYSDGKQFDDTLYVGSNLGFLHAINPKDGEEMFAFMPKELLHNGYEYFAENFSNGKKNYGLDAPLQVWRHDANGDGRILTAPNSGRVQNDEFIYLYQPMRRGGKNIYALDVSDRKTPKMLWQISGGEPEFASMGQSWPVPKRTKISWCLKGTRVSTDINTANNRCVLKEVLFFGGGYDPAYDEGLDGNLGMTDMGNAIYMVDAVTGEKLWSAGHTSADKEHAFTHENMLYSMVADVVPADLTGNGAADVLIAIDIQGQLWRFDFQSTYSDKNQMVSGGLIAQLSSNVSTAEKRRFYHAPDVSTFMKRGVGNQFLAISVASGYRTKPNDTTVNDKIVVLFDRHTFKAPESYAYTQDSTPIRMKHLVNIKDLTSLNADDPLSITSFIRRQDRYGIYVDLPNDGEKVMSASTTYAGQILVNSFTPRGQQTSGGDSCRVEWGKNKLYRLDLNPFFSQTSTIGQSSSFNNRPTAPSDNAINLVSETDISHQGIPPQPQVVMVPCENNCTPDNQRKAVLCIGLECGKEPLQTKPYWMKTYWRESYVLLDK